MLRNNPSKAVRRGKTVQITVRKPAETTLTGKNARRQHDIPRQSHFGGEYLHEVQPYTEQPYLQNYCRSTHISTQFLPRIWSRT